MVNSAPALFRQIARAMADESDPIGFFLREKYPICFSNTTDPFQRAEKDYRASEAFLKWAAIEKIPLYIQTRGNVLYEEFDRYKEFLIPGKDVVYLSICQMDDAIRRKIEPGAMALADRWKLARRLADHGIPVIVACNPYLKEWVPDPAAFCALAADNGVRGIWWEALHFTPAQTQELAKPYKSLVPKSNLLPMYAIGILKQWHEATANANLDFFPTPHWDAYFDDKAKHPECADPAWFGGKTLDFNFRITRELNAISRENPKDFIAFGWGEISAMLALLHVPNPTLKTAPFWGPYNAKQNGDYREFRATLGEAAPLHEIIRYFYNHPYENQNFLWYRPLFQLLEKDNEYEADEQGDLIGIVNRSIKHHGTMTHNADHFDWDACIWPEFATTP